MHDRFEKTLPKEVCTEEEKYDKTNIFLFKKLSME